MPRPRKYDGPGKTISFYCPESLISTLNERAAELSITRGEFIVRTLQGREIPGDSPQATPGEPGVTPGNREQGGLERGEGQGSPCSHLSVVNLGFLTRCVACGAEVSRDSA